ncbi:MAG: STAS domain-containing protein [Actinomycetota bacterium]|nr:STAS domain-containing protein [Actinomycetota bacterium]
MTLDIATQKPADRTAVIAVSGRLNAINVAELRSAVASAVDEGWVRIVLELRGVEFIDSSGLGGVISGLKCARQAGGDLRLVAPTAQVMMILHLTNLDQILSVYPTIEAACADDVA